MISPSHVATIAGNTVREAVRNKLLFALLFFAIGMIGCSVLLSTLSYVETSRIMQDVGLAAIRLFGAGIAIFVGVGLIHKEVDRRTIYTILSKPVSRSGFLLGKYVGLVLTVWLLHAIMSLFFVATSWYYGAPIDAGHLAALGLAGVELMLLVAVATLFSAFTTPMLASFFTVGIWFVGHLTRDIRALGEQGEGPAGGLFAVLYRVLPDLESFNVTLQATHGLPIASAEIWWPVLYGIAYSAFLLVVASALFERRDLR